ncbi:MAG: hypothetical protein Q4F44_04350 [Bacteroidales bacterium]|nr:hypothetical protein [Bacteroidales bacterium]
MLKFGNWINRKRHNRGFGIQSPSAFFFITQVLRERLPYYAYTKLNEAALASNSLDPAHTREIFRITNHLQPATCIAINSIAAACAMATARPGAEKYAIVPDRILPDIAKSILEDNHCPVETDNQRLTTILEKMGKADLVYIGNCTDYDTVFKNLLPYIGDNSVVIIEGIHSNKAIEQWWQQIVEDKVTVITYDMFSYGMVYFDKARYKQHYTLKR